MDCTTEIAVGVFIGGQPPVPNYRMSLENPNLPLNDPSVWEEVFGDTMRTDAGINVNEDTALMYAPVWQAVSMIASSVACLPFHHFKWRPDISATASEWFRGSGQDYLVSVSPEPLEYQTSIQFWESFMVDVLLWNNAYAYVVYDNAMRPRALRLLNPDRTHSERINGDLWYITEYTDERGIHRVHALHPWEVLHVRGLTPYGCDAPRFIKYARNSISLGLAQQKFASKFFFHGGRIGGVLELPLGMTKTARDTVEEGFKTTYEGADNPFKTVILRDSAKFHEAQRSPLDSQMVEASESQVRMIARWFNLSPALLGLSNSVSYNSKEQDNQAYLDHTLKRWLKKIQAECGIKLLADDRQSKEFFKHDVSDLISMDALKRAQCHQIYRQMEVYSSNDVRSDLNMLPREGGDEYKNPATSSPDGKPADLADDEKPKPKEAARAIDRRQARVLFHLTHVARQKARNRKAFMEWFDGGFKPQRDEWRELGGENEPKFFTTITEKFDEMVKTVTDDGLVSEVESITTTFEEGFTDGTPISE